MYTEIIICINLLQLSHLACIKKRRNKNTNLWCIFESPGPSPIFRNERLVVGWANWYKMIRKRGLRQAWPNCGPRAKMARNAIWGLSINKNSGQAWFSPIAKRFIEAGTLFSCENLKTLLRTTVEIVFAERYISEKFDPKLLVQKQMCNKTFFQRNTFRRAKRSLGNGTKCFI